MLLKLSVALALVVIVVEGKVEFLKSDWKKGVLSRVYYKGRFDRTLLVKLSSKYTGLVLYLHCPLYVQESCVETRSSDSNIKIVSLINKVYLQTRLRDHPLRTLTLN